MMPKHGQQATNRWDGPNGSNEASKLPTDGWQSVGKSRRRVPKGQPQAAPLKANRYGLLQSQAQQHQTQKSQPSQQKKHQQNQPQHHPPQHSQQQKHNQSRNRQQGSFNGQKNANTFGLREKTITTPGWKTDANQKIGQHYQFIPDLIDIADDDAQTSWRNREPPVDNIRIPYEMIAHSNMHESIAHSKQAFICPSLERKAGHGSVECGLWGKPDAVKAAKVALESWINISEEPKGRTKTSTAFGKVYSLTPAQQIQQENRWRREVIKQMFRQNPSPGTRFGAIGYFHWPISEYRPEDILGVSYEALDPIRMNCSTFIGFRKESSTFEVSGSPNNVQEALLRLRKTCFQIAAAKRVAPPGLYLLHIANPLDVPCYVFLNPYVHPRSISPERNASPATSHSPKGEGNEENATELFSESLQSTGNLHSTILKGLTRMQYYCGNLQMRLRLGTFLTVQYMEPDDGIYDLDEYKAMINDPNFEGKTTEELGHLEAENALLPSFLKAEKLLSPLVAQQAHLTDVKPTYTAVFTFKQEGTGDLRLRKSWCETYDATVDKPMFTSIATKWTRLARDADEPTSLMDINLQDLPSGLSWHIDLRAAQAVKKAHVPADLIAFAENIRMNSLAVGRSLYEQQKFDFVQYLPSRAPNLKSVRLSIAYGFGITWSDYTLELSCFQNRKYTPQTSMFPSSTSSLQPTISEPRWNLQVYRAEWDSMLAQNERLRVGTKVDWKPDAETWFPRDLTYGGGGKTTTDEEMEGWPQLLDKLTKIRNLVSEIQVQTEKDVLD